MAILEYAQNETSLRNHIQRKLGVIRANPGPPCSINPLGPLGSLDPLVPQNLKELPTTPIQQLKNPITAFTTVDTAAEKADAAARKTDTAAQTTDTAAPKNDTACRNLQ